MMLHTLHFVIFLLAASIFVAVATATGAYLNRVMTVRRQAEMRVPVAVRIRSARNN
ncbi:MAG: hypothetical protein HDR49_04915 [Bacteroides sp.]|nr:hypothetical protein [Bacteroides sp.]MBD5422353.1 hypothetical protein [Bacteroides sp.]